ncbi:MAG: hypothetical protein QW395_07875, partial [Candidatus Nitrosotenuis sp.]
MQKFALFFLLMITASTPFMFQAAVLAQEATEPTDEEMMDETMLEGKTPDETMTDEDLTDDVITSPLRQLMTGTDPHEIRCKTGQHLVFKASNWRPVCINESSLDILKSRGWVSNHDPSHDDLMKMMEGIPKLEETEVPEDGSVEIEEDIVVEEETIPGNETEEEPQSYTIEL